MRSCSTAAKSWWPMAGSNDVSGDASIQLSTAPSDAASQQTSLFQENLIGIRGIRFLNYTRRRDAAVQVLEDVSW